MNENRPELHIFVDASFLERSKRNPAAVGGWAAWLVETNTPQRTLASLYPQEEPGTSMRLGSISGVTGNIAAEYSAINTMLGIIEEGPVQRTNPIVLHTDQEQLVRYVNGETINSTPIMEEIKGSFARIRENCAPISIRFTRDIKNVYQGDEDVSAAMGIAHSLAVFAAWLTRFHKQKFIVLAGERYEGKEASGMMRNMLFDWVNLETVVTQLLATSPELKKTIDYVFPKSVRRRVAHRSRIAEILGTPDFNDEPPDNNPPQKQR